VLVSDAKGVLVCSLPLFPSLFFRFPHPTIAVFPDFCLLLFCLFFLLGLRLVDSIFPLPRTPCGHFARESRPLLFLLLFFLSPVFFLNLLGCRSRCPPREIVFALLLIALPLVRCHKPDSCPFSSPFFHFSLNGIRRRTSTRFTSISLFSPLQDVTLNIFCFGCPTFYFFFLICIFVI